MTFKLSEFLKVKDGEIKSRFDVKSIFDPIFGHSLAADAGELIDFLADHPAPDLQIAIASAKRIKQRAIKDAELAKEGQASEIDDEPHETTEGGF